MLSRRCWEALSQLLVREISRLFWRKSQWKGPAKRLRPFLRHLLGKVCPISRVLRPKISCQILQKKAEVKFASRVELRA